MATRVTHPYHYPLPATVGTYEECSAADIQAYVVGQYLYTVATIAYTARHLMDVVSAGY